MDKPVTITDRVSLSYRTKMFVVCLLYFAEGVPFGFIYNTLSVYFRSHHMSLKSIGMLSLTGLAWSLKLLWAPLVDRYGKRFYWIVPSQLVIALCMLSILSVDPVNPGISIVIILAAMCFASATQDIAVDAYTIDILDEKELGMANGFRVSAYRVALIVAGGGLVALSDFFEWEAVFVGISITMALIALIVLFWRPCHAPRIKTSESGASLSIIKQWIVPIKGILKKKNVWAVILFILLFKVGDSMMGSMVAPFWVDKGFTRTEIGLVSGTLGTIFSIIGSIVGGGLTTMWGIGRALWILGGFQAISNLGYAGAALPGVTKYAVYGASVFESFSGGLGTAAFLAFLMKLCDKHFSATQYALFSTIFSFSRSISGVLGGFGAEHFGYALFFFYTFLAACPAFALLPWVLPFIKQDSS